MLKARTHLQHPVRQNPNTQRWDGIIRMDELKLMFEDGDLIAAEIVAAPLEPGPAQRWCCPFRRRNGTRIALKLNRKQQGRD